jgi:hypothetical protein
MGHLRSPPSLPGSISPRPGEQSHAEAGVVDPQEPIGSARDRFGNNRRNFLRDNPDVDLVVPNITVTVETDVIGRTINQNDVPFETYV